MTRTRSQLTSDAARLAAIAGGVLVVAGAVQATVGDRIPAWTGDKNSHVALGVLTVVLGASVLVAARTLRTATGLRPETLTAITLWLAAVAMLCSTTVGRLSAIPSALALGAAGVTCAACGWHSFRSVVATHWLRGLLGLLGAFDILMAVSATAAAIVVAGLVAGGVLIAIAIVGRRGLTMGVVSVAATLPFVALTWWTIVTPLLAVVALVVGLAATRRSVSPIDVRISQRLDRHPVG